MTLGFAITLKDIDAIRQRPQRQYAFAIERLRQRIDALLQLASSGCGHESAATQADPSGAFGKCTRTRFWLTTVLVLAISRGTARYGPAPPDH